jgi:hypothetical protein
MAANKARVADWSADDLERAAKFMRELDSSSNSKSAFELAKREQDVEIAKERAREKEAEANRVQTMAQMERIRAEEQRKTMEAKRENEKVGWRAEFKATCQGTKRVWALLLDRQYRLRHMLLDAVKETSKCWLWLLQ